MILEFQISLCPALFDFQKLKIRCARLRFWISMHMDFHGFRCAETKRSSIVIKYGIPNSMFALFKCVRFFSFIIFEVKKL
jgi:hypothetical protein